MNQMNSCLCDKQIDTTEMSPRNNIILNHAVQTPPEVDFGQVCDNTVTHNGESSVPGVASICAGTISSDRVAD